MSGGARRLTVQGWQNAVLIAMGLVVIAGAVVGGVLIERTDDVAHDLIDDLHPARIESYQLQTALRDQANAVRGYAISADRQLLAPYFSGLAAERRIAEALRRRLEGRAGLLADLDDVETAAATWRTTDAEPLIAGVVPGADHPFDAATIEREGRKFDALRATSDGQIAHLQQVRDDIVADFDRTRAWRNRVLAVIVVAFLVTAVVLTVLVNRAVTRPLARLAASCRRITEGGFDEQIVPHGPRDIRAIATDVEDMRQRIAADLDAAQAARSVLDLQAIELRRSNAELEQFAYVASHDLQEPLRKVASFCQLLEKRYGDQLDERGTEYIAFAVDGAKRMQALINDLLTFSRVGRLNSARTAVDLDAALGQAIDNLQTSIAETNAEIVCQRRLPEVVGDPTLLTMLWQNLVGNAVKFRRPNESPRVVIDVEPDRDGQPQRWSFTVSDNGIGIEPEFVDKVFVIFQRLHGREVYGGTGIGLALCKKIVETHGGTIAIDTSYTGGTRFRFTLPVEPTATAAATATPDARAAATLGGTRE